MASHRTFPLVGPGWHHHMALSLIAVWFLIGETQRGQQWTPALTLPQVRYGLSLLLLEVCCTPGIDSLCRQVQQQLLRNESARFYHHRTRKCLPQRKLHRERQWVYTLEASSLLDSESHYGGFCTTPHVAHGMRGAKSSSWEI
jgi:hypothetical protein